MAANSTSNRIDSESKEKPKKSHYSQEVLDAMAEAKRISKDSSVPGYTNMDTLKNALKK